MSTSNARMTSIVRHKKESESPTQYYLTELGLDMEWQNSLLQFGPNVVQSLLAHVMECSYALG